MERRAARSGARSGRACAPPSANERGRPHSVDAAVFTTTKRGAVTDWPFKTNRKVPTPVDLK